MAISEVCKFEFKANVDRVVREQKISRRKAIATVAYDIGLLEETARKQDLRARKELGQIVPKESKGPVSSPSPKSNPLPPPVERFQSGRGGSREGSGRPPVNRTSPITAQETSQPTEAMQFAVMAISQLERIRNDDPLQRDALCKVMEWIKERLGS